MVRKDNKAEMQHYVPRMLLRNFSANGRGERLHVYDKHQARRLPGLTSVSKICKERDYYTLPKTEGRISLEGPLSDLEGSCEPILGKLIAKQSLSVLSAAERSTIALFVAVQLVRVPRMREAHKQIVAAMVAKAHKINPNAKNISEIEAALAEENFKMQSMAQLGEQAMELSRVALHHQWLLFRAAANTYYSISDCPVIMHNDRTYGPYGNIGFAVPGIQIYLPLSPTLALGLWERGLADEIKQRNARGLREHASLRTKYLIGINVDRELLSTQLSEYQRVLARLALVVGGMESGAAVAGEANNTTFFNSLQYTWSYRFLMCTHGHFHLAERMSKEQPHLRKGLTMKID